MVPNVSKRDTASVFKGQALFLLDFLAPEDEGNATFRNVGPHCIQKTWNVQHLGRENSSAAIIKLGALQEAWPFLTWWATLSFSRKTQSKGKAIPLQAWIGAWAFRRLRLPDFKKTDKNVVRFSALCTGCLYLPGNIFGTHICYRPSRPQDHSAAGRILSMKKSNRESNPRPSGW